MHGHTYHLEVELEGSIDENGMIMDFGNIKEHIQPIIDILDHRTLNEVAGLGMPTAENIIFWLKEQIEKKYTNLSRLRLWEGDSGFAEWKAESTAVASMENTSELIARKSAEVISNQLSKQIGR